VNSIETKNLGTDLSKENILNIMIVGSDPNMSRFLLEIFAHKGIRGHLANDRKSALKFLEKNSCDLIFTTDKFSQSAGHSSQSHDGFELLAGINANSPELPVVMITKAQNGQTQQQKTVETAVSAIKQGCCDFLIEPLDRRKIENILDSLLPNHNVSTIAFAYEGPNCLYRIVGRSSKLIQTVELAKRIAPTSAPVLVSGESGTGKELISFLTHHKSKRAQGPYIKVNCAALSDSLLESELFGHEKGAFTGAYFQRKGRFEMAHGGTLLLDEITETPLKFQAKLLRVLEQQDFERVGGTENVKVDVRVISTTNKDLLDEVQKGRFRKDLYYRLSGIRLVIPPLRKRNEDLYDLVWYFVNIYARESNRHIAKLDSAMMDIFDKYDWPGNVRQLRNVVRTSLILGTDHTLSLADVSWLFDELQPLPQEKVSVSEEVYQSGQPNNLQKTGIGGMPLKQVERRAILETLRQTAGNQIKAAKVLGISDRTLREKIHRYRREGCLQLT